ncbi:MAG: hypothetical protein HOO92_01890 [Methylococcaceae bacterium]|nr:hypothetical protein [Methylococcaceae bacterium]
MWHIKSKKNSLILCICVFFWLLSPALTQAGAVNTWGGESGKIDSGKAAEQRAAEAKRKAKKQKAAEEKKAAEAQKGRPVAK